MLGSNLTVGQALITATQTLEKSSRSPRLDAELLLSLVLSCDRTKLISVSRDPLAQKSLEVFQTLIERRGAGEPIAHILGKREFWKHEFIVTPDVLTPRPETEFLVERGIEILRESHLENPIVADLGTGSGCIACSIAAECKEYNIKARILAVDISQKALDVAILNAQRLGVDDIIEFRLGSWFEPLSDLEGAIDLIVSNPPYLAEGDPRVERECTYEPSIALYGGPQGSEALEILMSQWKRFAAPDAKMLVEFGLDQEGFFSSYGGEVTVYKDLQGHPRSAEVSS